MGIKNLTGKSSFPQIGVLRKGDEKPEGSNKPGKDLDYFRFDTQDDEAMDMFCEYYKDKPRAIRVFLPFQTVDENWDAWQEEWTASSLKHRCDGENVVLWLDKGKYSREPIACPYKAIREKDPDFKGGCKASGRLKVIIPELGRLAYVMVLTTSKNDIMSIDSSLRALYDGRGTLVGIPLILRRVEKEISTPRGENRARVTKSLITIEAQTDWASLHIRALQERSMPQLESGNVAQPLQLMPAIGSHEAEHPTLTEIRELWALFPASKDGKAFTLEEAVRANFKSTPQELTDDQLTKVLNACHVRRDKAQSERMDRWQDLYRLHPEHANAVVDVVEVCERASINWQSLVNIEFESYEPPVQMHPLSDDELIRMTDLLQNAKMEVE